MKIAFLAQFFGLKQESKQKKNLQYIRGAELSFPFALPVHSWQKIISNARKPQWSVIPIVFDFDK